MKVEKCMNIEHRLAFIIACNFHGFLVPGSLGLSLFCSLPGRILYDRAGYDMAKSLAGTRQHAATKYKAAEKRRESERKKNNSAKEEQNIN